MTACQKTWNRSAQWILSEEVIPVYLQRIKEADGSLVWRVSNATVERIPDMWDELGYSDFNVWLSQVLPEFYILGMGNFQVAILLLSGIGGWFVTGWISLLIAGLGGRFTNPWQHALSRFLRVPLRLILYVLLIRIVIANLGLSVIAKAYLQSSPLEYLVAVILAFGLLKSVSRLQDPAARTTGRYRIRRADKTRGGDSPHCHCDHRRTHVGGPGRVQRLHTDRRPRCRIDSSSVGGPENTGECHRRDHALHRAPDSPGGCVSIWQYQRHGRRNRAAISHATHSGSHAGNRPQLNVFLSRYRKLLGARSNPVFQATGITDANTRSVARHSRRVPDVCLLRTPWCVRTRSAFASPIFKRQPQ